MPLPYPLDVGRPLRRWTNPAKIRHLTSAATFIQPLRASPPSPIRVHWRPFVVVVHLHHNPFDVAQPPGLTASKGTRTLGALFIWPERQAP